MNSIFSDKDAQNLKRFLDEVLGREESSTQQAVVKVIQVTIIVGSGEAGAGGVKAA